MILVEVEIFVGGILICPSDVSSYAGINKIIIKSNRMNELIIYRTNENN